MKFSNHLPGITIIMNLSRINVYNIGTSFLSTINYPILTHKDIYYMTFTCHLKRE